jgi:small subunit ribosomal protein S6
LRTYETATIWSTSLTEAELENELDKVRKIIESTDGTILGTDAWGRRQMAYPIRKQTEGVYVFIAWEGEEAVTAGIDKHLRITEPCLRYLTLRSDRSGGVPEGAERASGARDHAAGPRAAGPRAVTDDEDLPDEESEDYADTEAEE